MALSDIPVPVFGDENAQNMLAKMLVGFQDAYQKQFGQPLVLAPASPIYLHYQNIAYQLAMQVALINSTGKNNLLYFAVGAFLDQILAIWGDRIKRIKSQTASTMLQFTLSGVLASDYVIPALTQVSSGSMIFQTEADLVIPAGAIVGSTSADCQTTGTQGNGITTGQVNKLLSAVPFVATVTNTTVSSGGNDPEQDDGYRQRGYLAPDSLSTAGPAGAYKFFALTADTSIIDVNVYSPTPGVVNVVVLCTNGTLPSSVVQDKVYEIFNNPNSNIRPLTDNVVVMAPTPVTLNLTVGWYIDSQSLSVLTQIQAAMAIAVQKFITWQTGRIARNFNPSYLIQLMMEAGASQVIVTSPVRTILLNNQVAQLGTNNVIYSGVEVDEMT